MWVDLLKIYAIILIVADIKAVIYLFIPLYIEDALSKNTSQETFYNLLECLPVDEK